MLSSSGTVMETNHYYPFGGVFSTSTNPQPYKYNGKELDSKNGLNWYDYGARHYDAALGRWFVADPLSNNHYGISPYSYCLNNPMKYIDPDGKDVRIAINGNTITIKANVILTGNNATAQLAKMYQDDIMNNWGSMTSYEYKGNTYELNWDVNVRVAEKNEVEEFNGLNNYMEVSSENSYVVNSQKGKIRNVGRDEIPFEFDNPISHEFGHILGLKDKYQKGGANHNKPISPEWTGNIMAEEAGVGLVDKKNLDILFPKAIDSYLSFIQKNDFIPWLKYMSMYYFINQNNRE